MRRSPSWPTGRCSSSTLRPTSCRTRCCRRWPGLLPLLELAAAGLLLTPWRMAGALLAGALLALYGTGMALALAQGRELDCGCGGEPLPVSWALVARNAVLASLAGFAAWPAAARALGWQDFLVVAAAVLLATLLYAALNQVLRHQAGLRARRPTLWRT